MRTILDVLGRIPRPSPAMGVALLALLIAASGAAVAAIPSSNGTITACYDKEAGLADNKKGTLRVISAEDGQSCNADREATLTWKDGSTLLGANQKAADSELLDGRDSSEFAPAYERTVVVSPTGTDPENGTALLNALDGITDASASKPYLLYIEPGTYDLSGGSLAMRQHVDIQGAGELKTVITSTVGLCDTGTVRGADNAELRFLTARNTGTGFCNAAIFNNSASPLLTHVRAESTGGGATTFQVGVLNDSSNPTMTNVTATASGGRDNTGVSNFNSNPTMTNVTATASGGRFNFGVSNVSSSNPTMTNVTATASGGSSRGSSNFGVLNDSSNPTMTNVTATASGGQGNTGVRNDLSSPTIRHSRLSGTNASLVQDGGTARVALTQLEGPIFVGEGGGTLQCFDNYDDSLAAVSCP